jgi:AraC-like DNA-binding protein
MAPPSWDYHGAVAREESVPPAFSHALLVEARECGCDVLALLAEAEIPYNPMEPEPPAISISVEQYSRLCDALFRALGDESGGIMPGSVSPFGTTRLLLHAVMRCKSLGAVLERAIEFNRCCREPCGGTAWLEIDGNGRLATLNYRDAAELVDDQSREGGLCGVAIWLRLCSWLIGQSIDPLAARCAGPMPASRLAIRHFYHCPVEFCAEHHSVSFSAQLLDAPVVRREHDIKEFLALAPFHLVIKPVVAEESVSARIGELVECNLSELPSFETLTDMLNTSARTLRRRLEKEGTSYQRIKDKVRRDAAISLLTGTGFPISEVASRVGFSDASAFHRSFKKWTGLAPGEYR